jgi:hypothetical protein
MRGTTCATVTKLPLWGGGVVASTRWRLVVADLMFGRGATARDRSIIASKVAVLARRGPIG